ncbi:ABC transporter transmembrane domain-containing protein [Pseudomonas piscis]|uniref:ABC transporter transmembrane domain-containing protein n=1 Tax=Pseudomonas piscis TaxID=2614538 RepID=UPI0003B61D56|nr:ABC transporter transmembrane domain-containing protein [Pseudomonas piscis]ERO65552.1 hypothetical protein P308_18560 [Pseudomonas piscis]
MIRALLRSVQPGEAGLLRRALVAVAGSALAQGAALALLPMAFASVFEAAAGAASWRWAGLFAGLAALCLVLRRYAQLAGYRAGGAAAQSLNLRIGEQLARLPLEWFVEQRGAELNRLVTHTVLQIMSTPAHLLQPMANALLTPLALLVALFFYDPDMALAALASVPLLLLFYHWGVRWGGQAERLSEAAANEAAARSWSSCASSHCCAPAGAMARNSACWPWPCSSSERPSAGPIGAPSRRPWGWRWRCRLATPGSC